MSTRPIIALLTDFGSASGYAAAMKGVILGQCPRATLVDITHDVPAHDVRTASYLLWSIALSFPPGTIFLCVVDPGVGSDRALRATSVASRFVVAPDNGLLDLLLCDHAPKASVVLSTSGPGVSATFHGRDVLAPAAAALWHGRTLRSLGTPAPIIRPSGMFCSVPPRRPGDHRGTILSIDPFGNLITNFRIAALPTLPILLRHRRAAIRTVFSHYAAAPRSGAFLLRGSAGLLEISVRNGSAKRRLGARIGDAVTLTLGTKT